MLHQHAAPPIAPSPTGPSATIQQPQLRAELMSNLPASIPGPGKDSVSSGELGPPVRGESGGDGGRAVAQHLLPGSSKKQLEGQRGC